MRQPTLIAQTPRAGRWNHCLLLPPGGEPQAEQARTLLVNIVGAPGAGRGDVIWGETYAAVVTDQAQITSGRVNQEILALVGVAAKYLSGQQRQQIEQALRQSAADLGRLVQEGIPWSQFQVSPDPHLCQQLEAWLRERFPAELPAAQPSRPPRSLPGRMLLFTGMALLALGGSAVAWLSSLPQLPGNKPPNQSSSREGGKQSAKATDREKDAWEQQLEKLANRLKIEKPTLVKELARLTNAPEQGLSEDSKVREWLKRAQEDDLGLDLWAHFLNTESRRRIRDFGTLKDAPRWSESEVALRLRRELFGLGLALQRTRDKLKGLKWSQEGSPDPDTHPFLRLCHNICNSAKLGPAGAKQLEAPVGPLFDQQDAQVLEQLEFLCKEGGIKGILTKVGLEQTQLQKNWLQGLRLIQDDARFSDIVVELGKERGGITEPLTEKAKKDECNAWYDAARTFLEEVNSGSRAAAKRPSRIP